MHFQLGHDVRAMPGDGCGADAEQIGNGLVGVAVGDERQDFGQLVADGRMQRRPAIPGFDQAVAQAARLRDVALPHRMLREAHERVPRVDLGHAERTLFQGGDSLVVLPRHGRETHRMGQQKSGGRRLWRGGCAGRVDGGQ